MPRHIYIVTSVVVAIILVGFVADPVVNQTHQGLVTISANSTTRPTDFQDLEARVDRMIRDGELQLIAVHGDRQLADRQHEAFAQYLRVYVSTGGMFPVRQCKEPPFQFLGSSMPGSISTLAGC